MDHDAGAVSVKEKGEGGLHRTSLPLQSAPKTSQPSHCPPCSRARALEDSRRRQKCPFWYSSFPPHRTMRRRWLATAWWELILKAQPLSCAALVISGCLRGRRELLPSRARSAHATPLRSTRTHLPSSDSAGLTSLGLSHC